MHRKDFLKAAGPLGLMSFVLLRGAQAASLLGGTDITSCVLITPETTGPYALNPSGSPAMFRQGIRENRTGARVDATLKILNAKPETGGRFKLVQNYSNPRRGLTTILFTLAAASDVWVELFDLVGRRVTRLEQPKLSAGAHRPDLNPETLGLAAGNYVYQLHVQSARGHYTQCKLMTSAR